MASSDESNGETSARPEAKSVLQWLGIGLHVCVCIGAAGVTLMLLLGQFGPAFARALLNPVTPHAWVCLLVAMLTLLCLRAWRTLLAVALPTVWASTLVLPVVWPAGASGMGGPVLRVTAANVLIGNPPDVKWLESCDADIVGFLEFSSPWLQAVQSTRETDGSPRWPYAAGLPDDRSAGGIGLFSRYPLRDVHVEFAPTGGVFRFVEATVETPDGDVRVLLVHPPPPVSGRLVSIRDAEIAWLAGRCAERDVPTIVMGDFNETPFGKPLKEFVTRTGYASSRRVAGYAPSWTTTLFGVRLPHAIGVPIDHLFVSKHFATQSFRAGPDVGSDHLPIRVELSRPASSATQAGESQERSEPGRPAR